MVKGYTNANGQVTMFITPPTNIIGRSESFQIVWKFTRGGTGQFGFTLDKKVEADAKYKEIANRLRG